MDGVILIVDDNPSVIDSITLFLKRKVGKVLSTSNPNSIPNILIKQRVDVVILDMNFESTQNTGQEGLEWLCRVKEIDPSQVVIMITAYGDVELAVEALKQGATDFIMKPWDNQKLWATISSGLELSKSRREVANLRVKQDELKQNFNTTHQSIIGSSFAIQEIFRTIQKVAPTEANVLILGENGTGKELVAREIHKNSGRAKNIFLSIDMGAIPESLFESELFGHEKGAFTDAKEQKIGRLVLSNGGTLFLDEIGNFPPAMQTKLLTVLQNREVTPVGGSNPIPIDVRLICATNRNINDLVSSNLFREDLLYRINTIQLELPPLRSRDEDIVLIANHYLAKYSAKYGKTNITFSKSAVERMMKYSWPGNVRELNHTVERAVIMCDGNMIGPNDLMLLQPKETINLSEKPITLNEAERFVIAGAMKRNKGNISAVAKELGIGRQTLYRKLKEYGL